MGMPFLKLVLHQLVYWAIQRLGQLEQCLTAWVALPPLPSGYHLLSAANGICELLLRHAQRNAALGDGAVVGVAIGSGVSPHFCLLLQGVLLLLVRRFRQTPAASI